MKLLGARPIDYVYTHLVRILTLFVSTIHQQHIGVTSYRLHVRLYMSNEVLNYFIILGWHTILDSMHY